MDLLSFFNGILGLTLLVLIAFIASNNKKKINWVLVRNGLILQVVFAIFILKGEYLKDFFFPFGLPKLFFENISKLFVALLDFSNEGAKFVFGALAISPGNESSLGYFFAFQVLPTVIFYASIMSVLYYLGIMQKIVQGMAWLMAKFMGTSGAESLSCSANIFVGQTEAPLMVKPFIKDMTNSEILTIMTGGMATIAGGVMAAYIQFLSLPYSEAMGIDLNTARVTFANHLLSASVMAAPAALLISKILFPETGNPITKGTVKIDTEKNSSNIIESAAAGASEGLFLALNIGAMLLAFISIIFMVNAILVFLGNIIGINDYLLLNFGEPLNMQLLFGLILRYLAVAIGVPWENSIHFGSLFGTKIVLNEFIAYSEMSSLIKNGVLSNPKAVIMSTYALCGFANFSSIAIQIGGLAPLAPERRKDIAQLGLKAVLGGGLATLMTATLAGILV